jgi:hypothetical protein
VLGAVHNRSLADRVLGSTATEVTKRARCDVLIVRPEKNLGELESPRTLRPNEGRQAKPASEAEFQPSPARSRHGPQATGESDHSGAR